MHLNYIDWHVTPFRADRFYEIWRPACARTLSYGAKSWSLSRSEDDPLLIRQASVWESKEDFERWWHSDEASAARQDAISYYAKPVLPEWHLLADIESATAPEPQAAASES